MSEATFWWNCLVILAVCPSLWTATLAGSAAIALHRWSTRPSLDEDLRRVCQATVLFFAMLVMAKIFYIPRELVRAFALPPAEQAPGIAAGDALELDAPITAREWQSLLGHVDGPAVFADALPSANTTTKGLAILATAGEATAGEVVEATDARLTDVRAKIVEWERRLADLGAGCRPRGAPGGRR